jgi:carbamate kinase
MTRVIVALGGNALLRRGQPLNAEVQRKNIAIAARGLAQIMESHEIVVTHGNGPQVGLLALQGEAFDEVANYPLDVLGAQTEGMIGYMLQEALRSEIPGHETVTLLTQVVVDPGDPAFRHPSKPVGPVYTEVRAKALAAERGWPVGPDGDYWRRVVPSPEPGRIVEIEAIRILVNHGATVICAGGGGIPVVEGPDQSLRGVEAVIDKDLSAALLATELEADVLVMLTDVDGVMANSGESGQRRIPSTSPAELRRMKFEPGTMGPKVEAACRFVESTGGLAAIGALPDLAEILDGRAGSLVRPDDRQMTEREALRLGD